MNQNTVQHESMVNDAIQPDSRKHQIIHWSLMIVLWILLFLETRLAINIVKWWNILPSNTSASPFITKTAEMGAFALSVIMILYSITVSVYLVYRFIRLRGKSFQCKPWIRLNSLVLSSFAIYWVIFILFTVIQ